MSETLRIPRRPAPEAELFSPAGEEDLSALWRRYSLPESDPFCLDLYEPLPCPPRERFVRFYAEEASVRVLKEGALLRGYFALHDFQSGNRLANLDFGFFDGAPGPRSARAASLWRAVREAAAASRLTRLQFFLFAEDAPRWALADAWGFRHEGTLREHVFHGGCYHDVALLAWMEGSRRGA